MADDFDVEAMLEAPYKKEDETDHHGSRDGRDKDRSKEKDRDRKKRSRSRSRDKDKKRDKERDRDRGDKDRDRKRRSRSRDKDRRRDRDRGDRHDRDRRRSRSRDRKRRSRSRERFRGPGGGGMGGPPPGGRRRSFSRSPLRVTLKNPEPEMTPEERDARTVFCMQLSARIRPRDLEEFFSAVGKVKDVRIITDNKTRRSKGIAYIEFIEVESVALAMGLTGQRLLGVPIIVQASQAEKNRLANAMNAPAKDNTGPMRLYVGSLHFNITEDMLRGIFEPFGKIAEIKLIRNHESGTSQGYGFIIFHNAEDAKKALEQLNGFELAGRPMKVGHVTERTADPTGTSVLDSDEMDRSGIDLGATGRLQLMAKLAEGTGFEIPQVAANALNMTPSPAQAQQPQTQAAAPPIATQCFMLSNMFDPNSETQPNWENEIKDDVIDECNQHGGVLHIYVDKASPQGNVYVKCPTISAAVQSVQALHGRWFAGKMITAAYVPIANYHSLFPDALRAGTLVLPSSQALPPGMGMGIPSGMLAGMGFQ